MASTVTVPLLCSGHSPSCCKHQGPLQEGFLWPGAGSAQAASRPEYEDLSDLEAVWTCLVAADGKGPHGPHPLVRPSLRRGYTVLAGMNPRSPSVVNQQLEAGIPGWLPSPLRIPPPHLPPPHLPSPLPAFSAIPTQMNQVPSHFVSRSPSAGTQLKPRHIPGE